MKFPVTVLGVALASVSFTGPDTAPTGTVVVQEEVVPELMQVAALVTVALFAAVKVEVTCPVNAIGEEMESESPTLPKNNPAAPVLGSTVELFVIRVIVAELATGKTPVVSIPKIANRAR